MASEILSGFFEAVKTNKVTVVTDLIHSGNVSVNAVDKTNLGMTALHYVAQLGYEELFDVLLAFEPDINIEDDLGYVPMTLAIDSLNFELAKKLIDLDPNNFYIEYVRKSNPQYFNADWKFIGSDSKN